MLEYAGIGHRPHHGGNAVVAGCPAAEPIRVGGNGIQRGQVGASGDGLIQAVEDFCGLEAFELELLDFVFLNQEGIFFLFELLYFLQLGIQVCD
ncbi:hypothetical protein LN384_23955 [Enterobacter hormaechei subsp. steigerwaltii]|nr:hypothetical protein [Enterobacter hormaechei subsp. steigerwaltii]